MAAIFVTPILGLTWLFGLLVINEQTVVFAWIFLVFNSLQVQILILSIIVFTVHLCITFAA